MEPVTVIEAMKSIDLLLTVFSGHLAMFFSMMLAFSLAYGVKKILSGD